MTLFPGRAIWLYSVYHSARPALHWEINLKSQNCEKWPSIPNIGLIQRVEDNQGVRGVIAQWWGCKKVEEEEEKEEEEEVEEEEEGEEVDEEEVKRRENRKYSPEDSHGTTFTHWSDTCVAGRHFLIQPLKVLKVLKLFPKSWKKWRGTIVAEPNLELRKNYMTTSYSYIAW